MSRRMFLGILKAPSSTTDDPLYWIQLSGAAREAANIIERQDAEIESLKELRVSDEKKMTVAEFMDRYYKPDRLRRDKGSRERLIADREQDIRESGLAIISRHDSVTGEAVYLHSPQWRPPQYIRWMATTDGEEEYQEKI